MTTTRRTPLMALVLMIGLAVGGCGGDGGDTDAVDETSADGAGDDTATTASGTGQGGYPACPLTEAQVSAVAGEPMEVEDTVCQFAPASGKLNPHVLFVKQSSVLNSADAREEVGLVAEVEGIGDEAYATDGEDVARVAVRDGQQWFEIEVDLLSDPDAELDWAKQLAKTVADDN